MCRAEVAVGTSKLYAVGSGRILSEDALLAGVLGIKVTAPPDDPKRGCWVSVLGDSPLRHRESN